MQGSSLEESDTPRNIPSGIEINSDDFIRLPGHIFGNGKRSGEDDNSTSAYVHSYVGERDTRSSETQEEWQNENHSKGEFPKLPQCRN